VRRLITLASILIAIGGLSFLLARGGTAKAAPSPSPKEVALHLTDLPTGFFQSKGGSASNAVVARSNGVSLESVRKTGRLRGYSSTFLRDTGRGVDLVGDDVVQFRTPRGADREYHRGVAGDVQFTANPGYKQLRNPKSGTALVTSLCVCGSYRVYEDVLDTHKGPYYFWIDLHFIAGTANPKVMAHVVLHYAAIIKDRIPPTKRGPVTSTPVVRVTPTAEPTPGPLHAPLIGRTCVYEPNPRATGVGISDPAHGITVCVETRDLAGSSNYSGYLGSDGRAPPPGDIFLHVWAGEKNDTGQEHYISSIHNFEAQGRDGQTFSPGRGTPYGAADYIFGTADIATAGSSNTGYVEFTLPEHDGPYAVLWNESSSIPFTPITTFPVYPSH
jgi:hypothetical protein